MNLKDRVSRLAVLLGGPPSDVHFESLTRSGGWFPQRDGGVVRLSLGEAVRLLEQSWKVTAANVTHVKLLYQWINHHGEGEVLDYLEAYAVRPFIAARVPEESMDWCLPTDIIIPRVTREELPEILRYLPETVPKALQDTLEHFDVL